MTEIILPAMGEGIIEAEITRWLVKEGQAVDIDQPLAEVATDKVDSEIPSPVAGTMHKIMLQEGDAAKVGQVMGLIAMDGENLNGRSSSGSSEPMPESSESRVEKPEDPNPVKISTTPAVDPLPIEDNGNYMGATFLSPVIRKLAMENGIYPAEIQQIKGSGLGGRITRSDVLEYLAEKRGKSLEAYSADSSTESSTVEKSGETEQKTGTQEEISFPGREKSPAKQVISEEQIYGGGPSTIEEMDRMRKMIADHMVYSKKVAPHVSSFVNRM